MLTTTGYVIKEELVTALNGHILKNTFVINIDHPFPGYYGQAMVDQSVPRSIIFITKNEHSWESILRAKKRINNYMGVSVDITKTKVSVWNRKYNGIRAKNFRNFSEIESYQKTLIQEGFGMMRAKKFNEEEALINLKKFYFLKPLNDNIYADKVRSDMNYAILDKYLNWELFRKITMEVKNNISDSSYDIAKGTFYMDNEIVDMVRIFKPNISLDLLNEIYELYQKTIKKYTT